MLIRQQNNLLCFVIFTLNILLKLFSAIFLFLIVATRDLKSWMYFNIIPR